MTHPLLAVAGVGLGVAKLGYVGYRLYQHTTFEGGKIAVDIAGTYRAVVKDVTDVGSFVTKQVDQAVEVVRPHVEAVIKDFEEGWGGTSQPKQADPA